MALSVFDDPVHRPFEGELARALGRSAGLWRNIVEHVRTTCRQVEPVWNFAGARFGWSLRLKQKERVLLYLTPQDGQIALGIVLGEKAAQAAHRTGLPESVLQIIDEAPRFAEGRGIRCPLAEASDLATVEKLLALKLAPERAAERAARAARKSHARPLVKPPAATKPAARRPAKRAAR